MVAILSVPIMSLIMSPMQGAALLLPVYLVSDVYGVWKYGESHSIQNLFILIPAATIGVFAGWLFAGDTDEDVVRGIDRCGLASSGWHRPLRPIHPRQSGSELC